MESIIRFMSERFNFDISIYDASFLRSTIHNQMVLSSCNSTKDYLIHLNKVPTQALFLQESLTNSHSEFFGIRLHLPC